MVARKSLSKLRTEAETAGRMTLSLDSLPLGSSHTVATDKLTWVVPLFSSVIELQTRGERLVVDRTTWCLAPAGERLALQALSATARVLLLGASEQLLREVVALYAQLEMTRKRLDRYFREPLLLPRTVWVYELCHRYLFERQAMNAANNDATRFLEAELVKEAYFLCRDREQGEERVPLVHHHGSAVSRALAYIEAHLFDPESVDRLARHCAASESTLLRAFRRELGTTPAAYWRTRRLDEALALLRLGDRSVSEIALHVGYENPAAFSQAFQLRFGSAPSRFVARHKRRAPP